MSRASSDRLGGAFARRLACRPLAGKQLTVKCPTRVQKDVKFAFENIMTSLDKRWADQPYPSQAKIYEMVAKPMIQSSIDGYNTTIVRRPPEPATSHRTARRAAERSGSRGGGSLRTGRRALARHTPCSA